MAHNDNYAINPRKVEEMVEKSRKTPLCDAKLGEISAFLGGAPFGAQTRDTYYQGLTRTASDAPAEVKRGIR